MSGGLVIRNSPYILGIDLGTSNSALAVFEKGEAKIVPVDGDKVLPSIVSVRDNGEVLVGKQARSRLMIDPDNTVASVKREIGTDWKKEFAGLPGKTYTPTDIAAEILTKLKNGAGGGDIDLRGTPKFAVICIPANFDDTQKNATYAAGELAGLEVLELLEEPVAAAIAYAVDRGREQTILVYDLGGGTFDVSILQVVSEVGKAARFQVLAKEGVKKLGGDDFDRKIMEIARDALLQESGVDILNETKDQGISRKAIREAMQKLKDAAETAKRELTEASSAEIILPNLIKDEEGKVHNLHLEITRETFNEAIRPLIGESKVAVEKALDAAKMTIDDISRIILVGGSTRVPLVKEMLTEMFGKEPYSDLDPDTAVARGAAIHGAALGVPEEEKENTENTRAEDIVTSVITIQQTVSHYLGIETFGGKFNVLLEKNIDIPLEAPLVVAKDFTTPRDNMSELVIRVYQAMDRVDYVGGEECNCIGEFFLTGIPPKPRGEEKIRVSFGIDQQNLLKIHAKSTGSNQALDIKRNE